MLTTNNAVLLVIDVQGKLAQLMYQKEKLFKNLQKIIAGARALEVPVIWVEQNPQKLGSTIPEVAGLLSDIRPIPKMSFSCCGCEAFMQRLRALNRKQVLITGIETHICIYQTAMDLVDMGYEVQVVADATSSRTAENREIGLERIKQTGAGITGVETVLFELLRVAEGEKFKEILKIVK